MPILRVSLWYAPLLGCGHGHPIIPTISKLASRIFAALIFISLCQNFDLFLQDIFIAGTETSSAAVEWAMAELIRNPETMRRAQDEVRHLMGSKNKTIVEETDTDELHYLKSVIKETLRLHPPAP